MINRYELSSDKMEEKLLIEYTDGFLSAFALPVKHPLNDIQFSVIMGKLPQLENALPELAASIRLKVTKEVPANLKIKLFCEKYMQYHNNDKYHATPLDGKKIKEYKITAEFLDHYFTTSHFLVKGKHSIMNLTKYYNEVNADFANKDKKGYPDYYSAEYANKLLPIDLPGYWRHLTSLNLKPNKNRLGVLLDWVKKV